MAVKNKWVGYTYRAHSVENMFAEVTLHNDSELSKNYPKMPKIVQKLPKIERLPQQLYFPHYVPVGQ